MYQNTLLETLRKRNLTGNGSIDMFLREESPEFFQSPKIKFF